MHLGMFKRAFCVEDTELDEATPAASTSLPQHTQETTVIVEKPVYVDKIVEVEKTVVVDKIVEVEKIVYVDRLVEVEKKAEQESVFFEDFVPADWQEKSQTK